MIGVITRRVIAQSRFDDLCSGCLCPGELPSGADASADDTRSVGEYVTTSGDAGHAAEPADGHASQTSGNTGSCGIGRSPHGDDWADMSRPRAARSGVYTAIPG